tara:strand:+ start:2753 stop:3085 length:333 start_codon:yes stop_codon:yes gene_type:complete
MKAELKPCPFCDSAAQNQASGGMYYCECSSDCCAATTQWVDTEEMAVLKWEAREFDPPLSASEIAEITEKETARDAETSDVQERIADLQRQIAGLESLAEIWEQELHRRR